MKLAARSGEITGRQLKVLQLELRSRKQEVGS